MGRGGSTRECRVRLSIMPTITPDLVEWLGADPKVSSSWRSLAKHLSLSTYIPSLEVSRRNRKTDSQRMKELLIIWRSVKPATYNVETLLNMLDLMGMKGMYEWIHLMTKERLSPNSLPSYVITRLNNSQHSSLREVRSDRIGRSITPVLSLATSLCITATIIMVPPLTPLQHNQDLPQP